MWFKEWKWWTKWGCHNPWELLRETPKNIVSSIKTQVIEPKTVGISSGRLNNFYMMDLRRTLIGWELDCSAMDKNKSGKLKEAKKSTWRCNELLFSSHELKFLKHGQKFLKYELKFLKHGLKIIVRIGFLQGKILDFWNSIGNEFKDEVTALNILNEESVLPSKSW